MAYQHLWIWSRVLPSRVRGVRCFLNFDVCEEFSGVLRIGHFNFSVCGWSEEEALIEVIEDSFISRVVLFLRFPAWMSECFCNVCFSLHFVCVNYFSNHVSYTNFIKAFFKGYGKWRNMLLLFNNYWIKLGSCFFEYLGIVCEAIFFWFEINQFLKFFCQNINCCFWYLL